MEGACNGGMLYHEVQESKLCAVHCVNTVLQGPFFSEFDLAALASDLDSKERQMMMEGVRNAAYSADGDFLSQESHNVSLDGDFSIQVLQRALEVWDLQVIPSNSPAAETAQYDPANESAFICHLQDHWFCIRKVNGEWYNFDSLYAAPQHLSKFYLSAYLDSLKGFGWSIFIVRGNFPRECPISSAEAPSSYGQWLSPDDAKRISTSSSNQTWAPPAAAAPPPPRSTSQEQNFRTASEMEDEDLRAAIAASLVDTGSSNPTTNTSTQGGTTIAEDGGSGAETEERRSRRSAAEAAVAAAEERRRRSSAAAAAAEERRRRSSAAAAAAEESGSRSGAVEAVAAAAGTTDTQDGQKK